jgi:hypothetical protein
VAEKHDAAMAAIVDGARARQATDKRTTALGDRLLTVAIRPAPNAKVLVGGLVTVRFEAVDGFYSALKMVDDAGTVHRWLIGADDLRALETEIRKHLAGRREQLDEMRARERATARAMQGEPRSHVASGKRA